MRTLNKSIALLDVFLDGAGELTLEEISKRAGLNKSTTRRIIISLIECGFVKQPKKRGIYSLGMKFLDYTQALKKHNPIMDIAEPFLYEINQIIDETVSLALWDGRDAVICQSIYPTHPLKVTSYEGTMAGLHYNSLGKAILAEIPETDLAKHLKREMKKFTDNTITDINDIKKNLILIRQEGVAIDDEEGFIGVRGIAATIKNNEGNVVGAVNILGPSIRLTRDRIRECVPIIKEKALKISRALGYTGK